MNEYEMALTTFSGWFAGIWIATVILSGIGAWAWNWVNDKETHVQNPILILLLRLRLIPKDCLKDNTYYNNSGILLAYLISLFLYSFVVVFAPPFLLLCFNYYPVILAFLLVGIIAHVTRFAFRHKRLFDKHITDKKAHSSIKSNKD